MPKGQSLSLEAGECVTLAPDSPRFRPFYEQVRPRSADEVREHLALSPEATKALRGACICGSRPAATAAAEDLDSADAETRAGARGLTYEAFSAYVYGANPAVFAHMKPVFDRYLEISKAVINVLTLADIEVADRATLTISASTHVVRANKVIIHHTGRIVCNGSTTFRIASLEGRLVTLGTTVSAGLRPLRT